MAGNRQELKGQLRDFWDSHELYWATIASADPTTLRNRVRAASFIPDGSATLDIACGNAENAKWLAERCTYFGIDLSLTGLSRAGTPSLRLICGDADELPFRDQTFQAVVATYAVEHAVSPARMLREICRVAGPKGRVVLLGPAWDLPFWFPNALHSKAQNAGWRVCNTATRFARQMAGWWFGLLPFETVSDPDALHSEFVYDSDAVYIVWTYEVIRAMKRWGFKLLHWEVDDQLLGTNPVGRLLKRALMLLPIYRHAGSTVLLVFERYKTAP